MSSKAPSTLSGMKVAIIGGSLGGLAAAHSFTRLGATATVFEKSTTTFEQRGACLGFVDVDMLQRIVGGSCFMRNGRPASLEQGGFYYGDVWNFLYSHLPEGTVKFGHTVDTLGDDPERPTVDGELFDVAVIADGGWSTLRRKYVDQEMPVYSGHQIWWASVDSTQVSDGLSSFDGQFGSTETATYTTDIYDAVILEAPKCDGSSMYACGFFIATPESEISRPERGENRQLASVQHHEVPDWFVPFVRQKFGHHANGDITRFAEACASRGKIAPSPVFEYAVSKTVVGRVVVVGDAAHLSTPWTAAGAHTALLDAEGLHDAFSGSAFHPGNIESALRHYDHGGVQRARRLLRQSHACSKRLIPKNGKHTTPSPASLVEYKQPHRRAVSSRSKETTIAKKLERVSEALRSHLGCGTDKAMQVACKALYGDSSALEIVRAAKLSALHVR